MAAPTAAARARRQLLDTAAEVWGAEAATELARRIGVNADADAAFVAANRRAGFAPDLDFPASD